MGYELVFHFCEKMEGQNEYDKETIQTKRIKIGDPYEDVPLEHVAGKVMAQLARRNIWVEDVEIYEIVKKKISYKETPDGILIKNRKFSFDEGAITSGEVVEPDDPTAKILQMIAADPTILQKLGVKQTVQSQVRNSSPPQPLAGPMNAGNVIRYEIFNPNTSEMAQDARSRGYAFTLGKKYPIYLERPANKEIVELGMVYRTMDDNGIIRVLSDKFFTPEVKLSNRPAEDFVPLAQGRASSSDGLEYPGGVVDDPMMKPIR